MFPPPTTTAVSTPRSETCLTWAAIAAMRAGSAPYSRSPINASPESLSSTRRNFGSGIRLLAYLEPGEPADDHVLAGAGRERGTHLLDRLAVVLVGVDVGLVEQHVLLQPLLHAALGDLLLHLLGLAL